MPRDLNKYAQEVASLVRVIKASFDPSSELRFSRTPGHPILGTRISGLFRQNGVVLTVKEYFNFVPERDAIDKDYRYRFISQSVEQLRIETQPGFPEHAHFPPRYLEGNGRHFNIDRWPTELQDMDFPKAFGLWADMVRNGGRLPEPFRSAK